MSCKSEALVLGEHISQTHSLTYNCELKGNTVAVLKTVN